MSEDECLRIVTGHWPPYSVHRGDALQGVMKTVLQTLAFKLDFCYDLVRVKEGGWGTKLDNGSWIGMMGMLINKEVDFALGPFGISGDRAALVGFSTPLFVDKQLISYRRPTLEPDLMGFLRPFTIMMWCLIFMAMIVVVLSTFGLLFVRSRQAKRTMDSHQNTTSSGNNTWSPGMYVIWIYGILLGQSISRLGRGNIARVLIGVWLIAAFIIASVYKSNLKAMLIIPKVEVPFDNLEGMLNQNDIPYILMGGSLTYNTFKGAEEGSLFGRAWNSARGVAWDYNDGLTKILKQGFAIIVDKTTILNILHSFFSRTTTCPLWLTSETIMSYMLSISFPKNSPLKIKFDSVLIRLRESGLLDYWLFQEISNSTYCLVPPGSETPEMRALQLQDMYGVFTLFLAGVTLSFITFLNEIIMSRKNKGKDKSFSSNDSSTNGKCFENTSPQIG